MKGAGKYRAKIKVILPSAFLVVPEDYSTRDKRDYFLDTITIALDQIQTSETLNTENTEDLLNKLLECVVSRRGQWRFNIFDDSADFNKELDALKRTIDERLDLIQGGEEEKKEEEETDGFDCVEEETVGVDKQSKNLLFSSIELFEEKGGSEGEGRAREIEGGGNTSVIKAWLSGT